MYRKYTSLTPILLVGIVAILASGCADNVCSDVTAHVNNCLGAPIYLEATCNPDADAPLLDLSCGELKALHAPGGKSDSADCMSSCMTIFGDQAKCTALCAKINNTAPGATTSIGQACTKDVQCTDEGAQCWLGSCTKPCAGLCPGTDTFCVASRWTSFPFKGLCVKKAPAEVAAAYACPNHNHLYASYCNGDYYSTFTYVEAEPRYRGSSSAAPATASICLPSSRKNPKECLAGSE